VIYATIIRISLYITTNRSSVRVLKLQNPHVSQLAI